MTQRSVLTRRLLSGGALSLIAAPALAQQTPPQTSVPQTNAPAATPAPMSMPAASPGTPRTPAPKDAYLYIIWPQNGTRVHGAFWCRFGLRNMGVTHAGDAFPNSGHHHLLVDATEPLDPNEPIPTDKTHLHFGGGQTEARLDLPPGKHTLQLVLGDAKHRLFDPPVMSQKITIYVVS